MYKKRSKFFQSFGFPHRLKNKKFKFTPPDFPEKKSGQSSTGSEKQKVVKAKLWSYQFKSPKPEWFNELNNRFRQYKILKNEWMQRQETKALNQIPGNSFEKNLREFDFRSLKRLCNKYLDLVDKEVRMTSMDRLEVLFDKKRKKMKYELYQINQLIKHIKR